ncbi:MAG TPA: ornithine carbamoyltransferase, partial [Candidatus Limnocylindrales bacterium]|nr:ornithine carbamoyltransferase [Candidatus Limnocylindrales bacterium]
NAGPRWDTTMTTTQRRTTAVRPRHFLTLRELGHGDLRSLLDLTGRLKREPEVFRNRLAGGRVGMIFDKPSTRTRVSLESAAWMLGMLPIVLRPDELQLGRGETVADTARALSLYLDALTVRTFDQATVEELAQAASIPVINALTNEHHPCQALADAMTIQEEFGTFGGVQVAFVGDGDNVCHSLIEAAAILGLELRVATPPGFEPSQAIVTDAHVRALETGGSIILSHDPAEAVSGAEVVYADVWTSMGKEGDRSDREAAFRGFTVDRRVMALASASAIFMHCLPAHRGQEVTDEVIDGPASRVWRQAANRLHTETALLYALLTGDFTGERLS